MSDLVHRLQRALDLTDSLAAALGDESLALHNGDAPSNTIGSQFWCLIGARESYARGITEGEWKGFACSLSGEDAHRAGPVCTALGAAHAKVIESVERELDPARSALVFDLLEHEVQHHGQLIRYFYANGITFPEAFARRYALQQPGRAESSG